jgi:hypothetical protein
MMVSFLLISCGVFCDQRNLSKFYVLMLFCRTMMKYVAFHFCVALTILLDSSFLYEMQGRLQSHPCSQ